MEARSILFIDGNHLCFIAGINGGFNREELTSLEHHSPVRELSRHDPSD